MPLCYHGYIKNFTGSLGAGRQRYLHHSGHSFGAHPSLHTGDPSEADGCRRLCHLDLIGRTFLAGYLDDSEPGC